VYVLCLAAVLFNMFTKQRTEALTGVGFVLVGAIVYVLFGRRGSVNGSSSAAGLQNQPPAGPEAIP
jgi:hypothetical protein